MGCWVPYASTLGMLRSSRKTSRRLPIGGPYVSFVRFSVVSCKKSTHSSSTAQMHIVSTTTQARLQQVQLVMVGPSTLGALQVTWLRVCAIPVG